MANGYRSILFRFDLFEQIDPFTEMQSFGFQGGPETSHGTAQRPSRSSGDSLTLQFIQNPYQPGDVPVDIFEKGFGGGSCRERPEPGFARF